MALAIKEPAVKKAAPVPLPAVEYPEPHRVTVVDLTEVGPWLVKRIQERYPAKSDSAIRTFLLQSTQDNDTFFMRSGDCVALANIFTSWLEPAWVDEGFVFHGPARKEDAGSNGLYEAMVRWAKEKGAVRLMVDLWTDLDRAQIGMEVGSPQRWHGYVIGLLPQ